MDRVTACTDDEMRLDSIKGKLNASKGRSVRPMGTAGTTTPVVRLPSPVLTTNHRSPTPSLVRFRPPSPSHFLVLCLSQRR